MFETTADTGYVDGTKYGLSIAGSYITSMYIVYYFDVNYTMYYILIK